jgi:16S rRNA (cytosine967-C5)-methyltransferase
VSPQPGATTRPTTSARAVAFDLIAAVLDRRRALDVAIDENADFLRLEPRDRAFARLLVATVLRRLGQLDRVIDHCLERPLPRKAIAIRHLLRLGIAQLLFLGTPSHAAVDTTVALAAARGGEAGYKGLVNAILRRVDRERDALLQSAAEPSLNTPAWLWQSWVAAYGNAVAAAIAAAHLEEPPLDVSVNGEAAAWGARLNARLLPTGSLRLAFDGAIEALPGFADGAWWVQDAAAALPARLLGDIAGKRVIDLCAAPGGKTAQLAAGGAIVTAVDRSEARLARVTANLARLGLNAATIVADAASWRPDVAPDAVLLDAPCSATGTIRRHPDVPWLKRPEDVPKLAQLQDRLLASAAAMAKPGGLIVYCTCSLQPEEGPERIGAILANHPVERVPIAPAEVGGIAEFINAEGDLRTLPGQLASLGGIDGFYAARLRRR